MKHYYILLAVVLSFTSINCSSDSNSDRYLSDPAYDSSLSSEKSGSSSSSSGNGSDGDSGLITAGEWNDLENWDFWKNQLIKLDSLDLPTYWNIHTKHRLSVLVNNLGISPMCDIKVELMKGNELIWTAKSDNFGKAELWINLYKKNGTFNISDYRVVVDGKKEVHNIKLLEEGVNIVNISPNSDNLNKAEISFVVDATGSMSDELEFLKKDLQDVITKVKSSNNSTSIFTSSVFYRDEGDEYVTKLSEFTSDISQTVNFIKQQSAGGGGDYPEAVHTALDKAINDLQWSEKAKSRIIFLLLDAPPHYEQDVVSDLHISIQKAAAKGIKIIPITASGVNKETEFLMRFFSISTNGTYVFITNDSGIGNDHLEASVGDYEVEFLNDLMVRLINKYLE